MLQREAPVLDTVEILYYRLLNLYSWSNETRIHCEVEQYSQVITGQHNVTAKINHFQEIVWVRLKA